MMMARESTVPIKPLREERRTFMYSNEYSDNTHSKYRDASIVDFACIECCYRDKCLADVYVYRLLVLNFTSVHNITESHIFKASELHSHYSVTEVSSLPGEYFLQHGR